jgi:competence protein ComGC
MINFFKKNKTQQGYVTLELLFYIAFFVILSLVVINTMITMTRSFKETTIEAQWLQSGSIMERISREIRTAYDINSISANDLKLNTQNNVGIIKTVEFLLSGSNVQLIENNILTGNLNTPNIAITGLTFTQITTSQGKAVKVFLTVKSVNDVSGVTQNFYDTIVLRGIY